MSKRAVFNLIIGGTDVTAKINPFLISLRVSDKVGTHSDTASIELDDRNGQLALPRDGDPVIVMLGWEGGGVRTVFVGTVDEVRSKGDAGGGMIISVTAKGIDTKSKVKEPQQRHFDKQTVKGVLEKAGKYAGITEIEVDPELASITREYVEMRDESFIHLGERLGREVGGNFRVQGKKAILSKRDGAGYTSFVMATRGVNLHSWDISPMLGRPQFKKTNARWYDRKKAKWEKEDSETKLTADAEHFTRFPEPVKDQAKQKTKSDKATSERDAGEGSVTIEGDTGAIPDGLCIVSGARGGVDGPYRIDSVDHEYSAGGGFVTKLSLKQPGAGN